jgi:Na+/H+ antiporter NhaD/arsenite permease-like protein
MNLSRFFRADISTTVLILANVVTIIVAVAFKWNVIDVMWVYWAQSIIIGLIACFRMLLLKQIFTAGFFLIHYGGFHLGYFFFLYFPEEPQGGIPTVGIALCIMVFLVNHAFSYWHNRKRDMNRKPNVGTLMFTPYVRIIPMHITIVFGSNYATSTKTLALFLVLKTIMDVIMHMIEHRGRRPEEQTSSL